MDAGKGGRGDCEGEAGEAGGGGLAGGGAGQRVGGWRGRGGGELLARAGGGGPARARAQTQLPTRPALLASGCSFIVLLTVLPSAPASLLTLVILAAAAAAGKLEATHTSHGEPPPPARDLGHHPHGAPVSRGEGEGGNSCETAAARAVGTGPTAGHFL